MRSKHLWVVLLFTLAAFHCVQAIFYDNYCDIDLVRYEHGLERTPFQGRIAMIPLLRLVHGHPPLDRRAHLLEQNTGKQHLQVEPYTAEKLACFWVSVLSMLLIIYACARFGERISPQLWWVCPGLVLAIFYASYAARADGNIWTPYDLPHAALFTLSCLAVMEGSWWVVALLFLIDVPMRETAIYIIPCMVAVAQAKGQLRRVVPIAAAMTVFWGVTRVAISWHFRNNPTETRIPYHLNYHALRDCRHWPQLATLLGFMVLPIALNRHRLSKVQRAMMVGALPGIAFSGVMGVWYETRVWAEWNGLAACLAFSIFTHYLKQYWQPASRGAENGSQGGESFSPVLTQS